MGGLLDTLGVGYSGVLASRAGIQLTSQNITNANTEGFHRRSLALSPVDASPLFGGGVKVEAALRVEDRLLGVQLETATGRQGFAEARQQLLLGVEQAIGDLGPAGVGSALAELFSSFSRLNQAPGDSALRGQVLQAAQQVGRSFGDASSQLATLAGAIDDGVGVEVAGLNDVISRVAQLNGQIVQAEAAGGDAGDLRDQQGVLIDSLASELGIQSFIDAQNQTTVLVGGMTLVQGDHAARLETAPDASLGGHLRVELVDGTTRTNMTARVGGRIGGQIAVRDQTIQTAAARLDQLAFDVATAVNTQHRAGFGQDQVSGRDLFSISATASGAAAQIGLAPTLTANQVAASATAAGVPGDGDNALALSQLASSTIAAGGGETASAEVGAMIGWIGGEVDAGLGQAQAASDEFGHFSSMAASREGVSLDEEMVHLIQYQRSYQASARVLQVVDSLLGRLIDMR